VPAKVILINKLSINNGPGSRCANSASEVSYLNGVRLGSLDQLANRGGEKRHFHRY